MQGHCFCVFNDNTIITSTTTTTNNMVPTQQQQQQRNITSNNDVGIDTYDSNTPETAAWIASIMPQQKKKKNNNNNHILKQAQHDKYADDDDDSHIRYSFIYIYIYIFINDNDDNNTHYRISCPKCSASLSIHFKFCVFCGSKINSCQEFPLLLCRRVENFDLDNDGDIEEDEDDDHDIQLIKQEEEEKQEEIGFNDKNYNSRLLLNTKSNDFCKRTKVKDLVQGFTHNEKIRTKMVQELKSSFNRSSAVPLQISNAQINQYQYSQNQGRIKKDSLQQQQQQNFIQIEQLLNNFVTKMNQANIDYQRQMSEIKREVKDIKAKLDFKPQEMINDVNNNNEDFNENIKSGI